MQLAKSFWSVCWGLVLLCLLATGCARAAEPMHYIYPPPESGSDVRLNYYWELLRAALDETSPKWGAYTIGTSGRVLNPARAEMQLKKSTEISIMTRASSAEREKTLLPIFIPLDKGLSGYRLFLTQAPTQGKLNSVRGLDDLKRFTIGQGINWIDTDILRNSGLVVVEGINYDGLFSMLAAHRFDLFARGLNEIGPEYALGKVSNPALSIEKSLLLYYPTPRYYFFSRTPEGERLAKRAEEGLRLMISNGKFDKHYLEFKRSLFVNLSLTGRRLIRLPNPYLSEATPLQDKTLWDTLENELKPAP